MRRRRTGLIQAALFAGMLLGVFYSMSDACTFMGIVRDPNQPFGAPATTFLNYFTVTACNDQSQQPNGSREAGWTLYHYNFNPATPTVPPVLVDPTGNPWTRHSGPGGQHYTTPYTALNPRNDAPSASYITARNTVTGGTADPLATAVVCHSRYSGNHRDEDDPHPFIYRNLFGKTYSIIHNGSLPILDVRFNNDPNQPWVTGLSKKVNVGFASVGIFNSRPYARWNHNFQWGIDSEYLAMLYMKYLLIANNYYWPGAPAEIIDAEEWAIRKAALTFDPAQWFGSTNTSINGILTDGDVLWGIAKSDNGYPHTVYYRDDYATSFTRRIVSESRFDAADPELIHTNSGQIVRVAGDAGDTPTPHFMDDALSDPVELRINSRANSTGDQKEPAISVDPVSGTWVAVWVSNNQILGRWYNQMGLAEGNEFVISTDTQLRKGQPAVAHSPTGSQITVAWCQALEAGATAPYKQIGTRVFNWNATTHGWDANGAPVSYVSECLGFPGDVLVHPRLAYSESSPPTIGGWAMTWQGYNCTTGRYEVNFMVTPAQGAPFQSVVPMATTVNSTEPDIVYVGNGTYAIVFTKSGIQPGTYGVMLGQQTPWLGAPTWMVANGMHPTVGRVTSTFITAVANNGYIQMATGNVSGLDLQAQSPIGGSGEIVGTEAHPDLSVISGTDMYVCYEKRVGANPPDIYCAHYDGFFAAPVLINQFQDNDQTVPVMAIAPAYNAFYETNSQNHPFRTRRMIIWQSAGQDGNGLALAGQFRGINATGEHVWSEQDLFANGAGVELNGDVTQALSYTGEHVYVTADVNVGPTGSLTFGAGTTVHVSPGVSIKVQGTLTATGSTFTAAESGTRWSGIYLTGSATLTNCTVEKADIAIQEQSASALTVSGCTIQNNVTGIYVYAPTKGAPIITRCTIVSNLSRGISLVSTYKATISDCPDISYNGADGILLTSSYAEISECHFTQNTNYGVNCYASSPVLYCNEFLNDLSGEMYLTNGSHPVLWSTGGVNGGANSFENTGHTLIIMLNSYPVCSGGLNRFTIYGMGNYYMQDLSSPVPTHDIKGNQWSQNPPPNTTFSPTNTGQWKYSPTGTYAGCGGPKGTGTNAAESLFEQGFTAEAAGNTAAASTAYMQTIAQYPDSSWAQVAAIRLFENQRQVGVGFGDLETYYASLQTGPLAETAEAMTNRSLVENAEYSEAVRAYDATMADPPSTVDSVYAAVDRVIAVMRSQAGDPGNGLNSAPLEASANTLEELLALLQRAAPQAPASTHEVFTKPPETLVLEPNYPNPFNATTVLRYALPSSGPATLSIYNIVGQKVATLVNGHQEAGYHTVSWSGSNLASGVYVYQLEANGQVLTHKMLLLK